MLALLEKIPVVGPRLAAIPHRAVVLFFSHALCFSLGMAYANSWATKTALEVQADTFSKQQAEVSQALIVKAKDDQKRVNDAVKQQAAAYDSALEVYEQGMEDAMQSADKARRELASAMRDTTKLRETVDGLKGVQSQLLEEMREPSPGCVLSERVRQSLDAAIARNNLAASRGDPQAPGTRVPEGDPAAEFLTCEQLARGFIDGLQYEGLLIALLLTWDKWDESLKQVHTLRSPDP